MAIYTNEHLTDLLNEQYEKARDLEKKLNEAVEVIEYYAECESEDLIQYDSESYCEYYYNTGKRARAFLATLNEVRE